MKYYDLITPEGTKDYLFQECALRRSIEQSIQGIFKRRGFSELMTPVLEFYDVFRMGSAYFPQQEMYKLVDSKGRLLVIRPDSTMPIARVVATRLKDAALPLRLFYNQCVYSLTPACKGRSDQVAQMGIELIGSASRLADLEMISAAVEVLSTSMPDSFTLEIGEIGIFKELIRQLQVDEETQEEIRDLIENKNYPALNDLLDTIGKNEITHALKRLPRLFGGEEVFEKAAKLCVGDTMSALLSNLRALYHTVSELCGKEHVRIDLGMVNRTDYYTGILIRGYLSGYGDAVLSGGRYDKLISEFGYDVPATGFAVNIDAVAKLLEKHRAPSAPKTDAIVFAEEGFALQGIQAAQKLREDGSTVEFAVQESLDAVRAYAKEKGIAKIIVINADETEAEG